MWKPVPEQWLIFFFSFFISSLPIIFSSSSHYYSSPLQSWTHNIQREKEFLRKLVKARIITDLTSGIWGGTATVLKGTAISIQLRTRAARRPWQESQLLRDSQCSWKVSLTCSVCLLGEQQLLVWEIRSHTQNSRWSLSLRWNNAGKNKDRPVKQKKIVPNGNRSHANGNSGWMYNIFLWRYFLRSTLIYIKVQNGAWIVHRLHGTPNLTLHLAWPLCQTWPFCWSESVQDLSVVGAAII